MNPPQCIHGDTDWAMLVLGDPAFGSLLTNHTARGCRPCLKEDADFMFRQPFVDSVMVVPTTELLQMIEENAP